MITNTCDPGIYEGDVDGYIDHLVADHGLAEVVVGDKRRALDQGSWMLIDNLHRMMGPLPRHRLDVQPDTASRSYGRLGAIINHKPTHRKKGPAS